MSEDDRSLIKQCVADFGAVEFPAKLNDGKETLLKMMRRTYRGDAELEATLDELLEFAEDLTEYLEDLAWSEMVWFHPEDEWVKSNGGGTFGDSRDALDGAVRKLTDARCHMGFLSRRPHGDRTRQLCHVMTALNVRWLKDSASATENPVDLTREPYQHWKVHPKGPQVTLVGALLPFVQIRNVWGHGRKKKIGGDGVFVRINRPTFADALGALPFLALLEIAKALGDILHRKLRPVTLEKDATVDGSGFKVTVHDGYREELPDPIHPTDDQAKVLRKSYENRWTWLANWCDVSDGLRSLHVPLLARLNPTRTKAILRAIGRTVDAEARTPWRPRPDSTIDKHVESSTFVPVLGPDIWQLENRDSTVKEFFASALADFQDHLLVHDTRADDKQELYDFARSVVAAHTSSGFGDPSYSSRTPPSVGVLNLNRLRGAVARLAVAANKAVGQALTSGQSVMDLATVVKLPESRAWDKAQLMTCLFDGIDAAQSIERLPLRDDLDGLGAKGIRGLLVRLLWRVFGADLNSDTITEANGWDVGLVKRAQDCPRDNVIASSGLELGHLEWIADLFWHLMRFNSPKFPMPTALAFQLALHIESAPTLEHRRWPLEQLVHAAPARQSSWERSKAIDKDRAALLTRWMPRWCEGDNTDLDRFYLGIAQRVAWQAEHTDPRRPKIWPPVVIDVNLDNYLERKLRCLARGFHMLLPVWRTRKVSSDEQEDVAEWLALTCTFGNEPEWEIVHPEEDSLSVLGSRTSDAQYRLPLIVKLSGAPHVPLDRLDGNFEMGDGGRTYSHRLVLSDVDIMWELLDPRDGKTSSAKSSGSARPDKVSRAESMADRLAEFCTHRNVWFFGYSVRHPSMRLKLFELAFRWQPKGIRSKVARYYLPFPENRVDERFLRYVDMTEFAEGLERVFP